LIELKRDRKKERERKRERERERENTRKMQQLKIILQKLYCVLYKNKNKIIWNLIKIIQI